MLTITGGGGVSVVPMSARRIQLSLRLLLLLLISCIVLAVAGLPIALILRRGGGRAKQKTNEEGEDTAVQMDCDKAVVARGMRQADTDHNRVQT